MRCPEFMGKIEVSVVMLHHTLDFKVSQAKKPSFWSYHSSTLVFAAGHHTVL